MKRCSRLSVSRRSGCATCKDRHKKCDEQKPRCKNCTRLNLECKQPDLFRASQLSTRSTGRAVAKPNETETSVDTNSNVIFAPPSSCNASHFNLIPSALTDFWPTPQASPLESYLRQHYTERLSSVLVNVDGPSNSLRCVILPRALTSPMLMNAIYATSSLHIFIWNNKSDYRIASLRYYNKAASALHRLIANIGIHSAAKDRELSLLTSVFLCKYEIISGGLSNWRSHLRGLQKMLSIFQRKESRLSQDTVSYIQSFIAYHWYIAGITRTERLSSLSTSSDTDEDMEREIVLGDQIDPYMGVSGTFISLLHSAAQIIMFDFAKGSNLSTIMNKVTEIYYRMKSDAQASEHSTLCCGLAPETMAHLDHIANAYRNAVVVYLHTILDIVEGQNVSDASVVQCFRIRSLLYNTKGEAISACVDNIMRVPEDSSPALGLSPLLFIVASETRDQTEFQLAYRRLTLLWKRTCLGNIGMARELLEKIRQANCLDWRQVLKPRKWDLIIS